MVDRITDQRQYVITVTHFGDMKITNEAIPESVNEGDSTKKITFDVENQGPDDTLQVRAYNPVTDNNYIDDIETDLTSYDVYHVEIPLPAPDDTMTKIPVNVTVGTKTPTAPPPPD